MVQPPTTKIDESTTVPLSLLFKIIAAITALLPIVWWAATVQTTMTKMAKDVELIPQMQQDIAILLKSQGLASATSTPLFGGMTVDPNSVAAVISTIN